MIFFNIKQQKGLNKIFENDEAIIFENDFFVPPLYLIDSFKNRTPIINHMDAINRQGPHIYFNRLNPTLFDGQIIDNQNGTFLVLNENFNKNWTARIVRNDHTLSKGNSLGWDCLNKSNLLYTYITTKRESIPLELHFEVNGHANAWYIPPQYKNAHIVVEFSNQKYYELFIFLSIMTFSIVCFLLLFLKITSLRSNAQKYSDKIYY